MARRNLAGLRAIVTGASSGIGKALALELAAREVAVVLVARSEERLLAVAAEIGGLPGRCEIVVGDVTDHESRRRAIARSQEVFGGLDLLVNNAGVGALGPFVSAGAERLRAIMEVNFFAPAEMIRAALGALRNGRNPMIVNVTSILGRRGIPHSSEYCASKFALEGLSQALRAELARIGIDLLVVAPGTTDTPFFANAIEITHRPPWLESKGVGADRVAREIVRAISAGKRELIPSFRGRLLCSLQRAAPWLVDRALRKYG